MQERGLRVLTGSKDATVRVTAVRPTGEFTAVREFAECHSNVVKCVRWRDDAVSASAGNDGNVCVLDHRAAGPGGATLIEDAHPFAVNVVEWHPGDAHLLLSASFSDEVLLHDLRRPAAPLHRFTGHIHAGKSKKIYHPVFIDGGRAIATSGEKSERLSLYCTRTGSTISRGHLGFDALSLYECGETDNILVAATTSAIQLYAPTWTGGGAAG